MSTFSGRNFGLELALCYTCVQPKPLQKDQVPGEQRKEAGSLPTSHRAIWAADCFPQGSVGDRGHLAHTWTWADTPDSETKRFLQVNKFGALHPVR